MTQQKERIAIVDAKRTPFTKAGTLLKGIDADQLGVYPLKETILRSGVKPEEIDEVVVGCCGQPAHAANVGRVIALRAGIPHTCASNYGASKLCIWDGGHFNGRSALVIG